MIALRKNRLAHIEDDVCAVGLLERQLVHGLLHQLVSPAYAQFQEDDALAVVAQGEFLECHLLAAPFGRLYQA